MLNEEDLILMYCLVNMIRVIWVNVMKEHMMKSKRVVDYRFPYAIMVSKFLDYFEVDVKDELNETMKAESEIDCSTLLKMRFQKSNNL